MRNEIVFYLNDKRLSIGYPKATQTLTDFLRNGLSCQGRLTGTKVACAEGDCGACTVLVGKPTEEGASLHYETIDACIAFVHQMDRTHIVTVEGLASSDGELNQVQQAMVDCHGSQCGFCTPGFVMTMQGLIETKRQTGCNQDFTEEQLRLGYSGNLCRCTGYEQIFEAGRTLDPTEATSIADRFNTQAIAEDLRAIPTGVAITGEQGKVFLPETLDQLVQLRNDHPDARLVAGATDLGVRHNHGTLQLDSVIDTKGVSELHQLEMQDNKLIIGAAVSWSAIESYVAESLPDYAKILSHFGSPQIRNAGTLAGNLANASPIADSIPFHLAAEAELELASVDDRRNVPLNDFYLGYKELDLKPNEVITRITTPMPTESTLWKLYKVSKRLDMDISTVTAAFWLEMDGDEISSARIAIGGVGPVVLRATDCEEYLQDRQFDLTTMQAAGKIAAESIAPISDVRSSADYRTLVVKNLFSKCYFDLAEPAMEEVH